MYPLISDRGYVNSIELPLPDITHAWIGASILFLGIASASLLCLLFPKNGEKKEEKPKPKKENFLKTFYNNQGLSGVIEFINNCVGALKRFSVRFIKRAVIIKKFHLDIHVTEDDAAATAIKYGKVCAALYPSLGFICSNMKVKDYKANVFADYCGEKTTVSFVTKTAFIPRALINAGIALVFSLLKQLLKVVISNNKSSKNNVTSK